MGKIPHKGRGGVSERRRREVDRAELELFLAGCLERLRAVVREAEEPVLSGAYAPDPDVLARVVATRRRARGARAGHTGNDRS